MSIYPNFILGVSLDATPEVESDLVLKTQLEAARVLDESGIDFITLHDSFEHSENGIGFDALLTTSFISAQTRQIGLIPTVSTTHTEPFHIATATATLDFTGRERGGWQALPSLSEAEAKAFGRRAVGASAEAWDETAQVIDVVRKLWNSWEADAEIRDARTGRFIDREKLHYIDASLTDSVGEKYSVKGPSIVPRPPQGNPPVFVRVEDRFSLDVALKTADVIIVPAEDRPSARQRVKEVEVGLQEIGRGAQVIPSLPLQLESLRTTVAELITDGISGLHVRLSSLSQDITALVDEVVDSNGAYGQHSQAGSLRERLGLQVVR